MPPALPLEKELREELVGHMVQYSKGQDPLSYLEDSVFEKNPEHVGRIPTMFGRPPQAFYLDVVRYCEMSAWSEEPPLIISLLNAFKPVHVYPSKIKAILDEGPFRCHPSRQPYWVCRVTAELPLLGRQMTRYAAIQFGEGQKLTNQPGHRVLRVSGPAQSGKSYTLKFFEYLAAIQPLQVGVLHFDFGEGDIGTLAENERIEVELYIARRLEEQVRRHRQKLNAWASGMQAMGGLPLPGLPTLGTLAAEKAYAFRPLTDAQQRTRWAGELAGEFVKQVLSRMAGVPPVWWVLVFDTCEKIPHQAEEFVRQLIGRAAGTDSDAAVDADRGPLRVVLLGDSGHVIPSPVYQPHILEDDLTDQTFGEAELKHYFATFCLSRLLKLDDDLDEHDARLQQLAERSLKRASEIFQNEQPRPPWPRALARAVLEETLPLEAQVAEKRGGAQQQPQPGVTDES